MESITADGDHAAALRLATNLGPLAAVTGRTDLAGRIEALLAGSPPDLDRGVRADALLWLAELGAHSIAGPDTLQLTRTRWREGMDLARQEAEPLRVLRGLAGAILTLPVTQDFAGTSAAAAEGRALAAAIGHVRWLGLFTAWTGMVRHQMRDFEGAARCAEEALGIGLRASDPRTLILVGLLTSSMPKEHLPPLPLLPPLEDLYSMAVELRDRDSQSWLLGHLAGRAIQGGDYDGAASWTLRRLDLVVRSTAWHGIGFSLMASVSIAAGRGELRLAARTHGAMAAILPTLLAGLAPHDAAHYERLVDRVRSRLGATAFDEEVRAGALLSWPEAVAQVIPVMRDKEEVDASSPDHVLARPGSAITSRERDVLLLLAEGLSNKDIAKKLGVRPKTVGQHTMSIYRKLDVRGRTEATAVAIRLGLVSR